MVASQNRGPLDEACVEFDDFYLACMPRLVRFVIYLGGIKPEAVAAAEKGLRAVHIGWNEFNHKLTAFSVTQREFLTSRVGCTLEDLHEWEISSQLSDAELELFDAKVHHHVRTIRALPFAQRQAYVWRLEKFPYKVISGVINKPAVTIRSNVRYARKTIKKGACDLLRSQEASPVQLGETGG
ncbi:hypothetical protein [Fodinicola acaciae]|uniref:hypothetical protein n=1 Tax=Fodinicola acaciae TaxID=2681555 RepID=UPI0013D5F88A|nr:hypothetical protein [Fodinicola acaciae]